mgnify:CR=1 FL=1
MGSTREHAMERRQKPKGKARTSGGPLLGPDDRPIPRRRPTGTPVPQGMSPRRKSSPEAVAKARAAYAEMMKRRAEARNKRNPTRTPTQNKDQAALKKANENRMSKNIDVRMGQLATDRGLKKGTKSTVGDKSVNIDKRMGQLAIERGLRKPLPRKPRRPTGTPVPQAKESPASIAARKRFNDRLKRQTATYNKTKPTTANQKGIPPSAIKEMQDANKKMQAKVFGGGKKPTSRRTFART